MEDKILKALLKPSKYGIDLDISKYVVEEAEISEYANEDENKILEKASEKIGIEKEKFNYIQINQKAIFKKYQEKGLIVIPLKKAIEENEIAKKFSWKIIDPSYDKYTALTYLKGNDIGYFIYVPPNTKIDFPIYNCLILKKDIQLVHNLIFVDKNSEAHIISGCTVPHQTEGIHIGISEFYISKNAKASFTMLHSWSKNVHVRPRTVAYVEENGEFINYYISYSEVASLQMYPKVILNDNAKTQMYSLIIGKNNAKYDIGSEAILNGKNSSAEIISRVIALEESEIITRAKIIGKNYSKGHIECFGLIESEKAKISTYPILISKNQEATLTHEAAIGKISREEIEYLMAKGFNEEEAKSIIIRGFSNIEVKELPEIIRKQIQYIKDRFLKITL